jgi:hypothetical protein
MCSTITINCCIGVESYQVEIDYEYIPCEPDLGVLEEFDLKSAVVVETNTDVSDMLESQDFCKFVTGEIKKCKD